MNMFVLRTFLVAIVCSPIINGQPICPKNQYYSGFSYHCENCPLVLSQCDKEGLEAKACHAKCDPRDPHTTQPAFVDEPKTSSLDKDDREPQTNSGPPVAKIVISVVAGLIGIGIIVTILYKTMINGNKNDPNNDFEMETLDGDAAEQDNTTERNEEDAGGTIPDGKLKEEEQRLGYDYQNDWKTEDKNASKNLDDIHRFQGIQESERSNGRRNDPNADFEMGTLDGDTAEQDNTTERNEEDADATIPDGKLKEEERYHNIQEDGSQTSVLGNDTDLKDFNEN